MTCPLFEPEPAWMRKADPTVKARPLAQRKTRVSRVAHCDDAGTRNQQYLDYGANARKGSATRAKVSHRDAKATAPQARYTSSVTMTGVAHQGSLPIKKS